MAQPSLIGQSELCVNLRRRYDVNYRMSRRSARPFAIASACRSAPRAASGGPSHKVTVSIPLPDLPPNGGIPGRGTSVSIVLDLDLDLDPTFTTRTSSTKCLAANSTPAVSAFGHTAMEPDLSIPCLFLRARLTAVETGERMFL